MFKVSSLLERTIESALADLQTDDIAQLLWRDIARPEQLTPEVFWRIWFVMAGRGWGKTRTGAEHIHEVVRSGKARRIALIAPTAADVRDVIVEGESGLLATALPGEHIKYEPSKRRLTWENGAIATTFGAEKPSRLRGPQFDYAWCDELPEWKDISNPKRSSAWDMLQFALRLGENPRAVITCTPKPIKIIRDLLKRDTVHLTTGSTYENKANLAQAFLDEIVSAYEGTRLGRQELNAEILSDVPGALWTYELIDNYRISPSDISIEDMVSLVVAVDPAASANATSDETGIIVAGRGRDNHAYVWDDVSLIGTPDEWASTVVNTYKVHQADRIVAERNNGGDMVEHTIKTVDEHVPIKTVWASRGKRTRAEPISALYEQGKVHHVGTFPELETQQCEWVPGEPSPDRMDALVWALSDLMVDLPSIPVQTRKVKINYGRRNPTTRVRY